jgi:hypothetical protein
MPPCFCQSASHVCQFDASYADAATLITFDAAAFAAARR